MPAPTDPKKTHYMFSDDIKFLQKAAIFHPHEPKILALRRSLNDDIKPGNWDLIGGNVAFGEKNDVSIQREAKEEAGIEVTDLQPIKVSTNFEKDIYYLFIGYKAKALSSEIRLSHEHIEYKWVQMEEFLELQASDYLKDLVKEAFKHI